MTYSKSIKLYEDYGDGIGQVDYVQHMGNDAMFVNAARVSFGKHVNEVAPADEKLLRYMIDHKHTSPFEHGSITFRFKVPLPIRSQHHRHRTWSYNEISRRYTDINIEFHEPKQFRTQHKNNRQASNVDELINPLVNFDESYVEASTAVKIHYNNCLKLYNEMVDNGICREQAREVLPQGQYAEYFGTVNVSNLIKYIDLRSHEGVQEEHVRVASACLEIATDLFPITVNAYREIKNG